MSNDLNQDLSAMRHSLAHILAAAIQKKWPEAKFGVGPVIENGFYYDIDLGETKLSEDDFKDIEKIMGEIIAEDLEFARFEKSIDKAIDWARDNNQTYKLELLNDLKRAGTTAFKDLDSDELGLDSKGPTVVDKVSFYSLGSFVDLCRGPHLERSSQAGSFKITKVAGAYWRGKETNPQLQRIYAVAFQTKEQLDEYLLNLEEAKKRDHRKLGYELDLFIQSDLVGPGLPIFTPRGTIIREELSRFSNELREKIGFKKVWTPHITKKDLYEKSGHWAKFGDELFLVTSQETSDQLALKPMNCPHHTQIFAAQPRSYRDLPIRYLETTTDYRDEKSGELGGLNRVRSLTQDDSHVFCRRDQMAEEIKNLLDVAQDFYATVGMELSVRLSYRDNSEAYLGSKELWQTAQDQLKSAVIAQGLDYIEEEGEAAFYGPKIDFMAKDAMNRQHQVATVQLDFVQPQRFELSYINEDGQPEIPVMIHAAIMGSLERFMSVYIEHTAGKFPVWTAPEQIRLITVNQTDSIVNFSNEILEEARSLGLRVEVDNNNESVGKKIRIAETLKIPYVIVIGEKELETRATKPRIRSDLLVQPEQEVAISNFLRTVANEAKTRTSRTTM